MRNLLVFTFLLSSVAALSAQDCLCCKKQKSGQQAYDRGDYATARDQWTRGLRTSDADQCPDLKSLLWKAKDDDSDGVVNGIDKCDHEPGPASNGGCPVRVRDRDGDGIEDREDNCPDQKGPRITAGCPDRDQDGIADKADACPDDYGPGLFSGCPDKDGDGIADRYDACPGQHGPKTTQGCPDSDGDGVADKDDDCDHERGPVSNRGCPATKTVDTQPHNTPATRTAAADMAFIKGGTYTMGNVLNDTEGGSDETPHTVTVGDFYISKYETSFDEYDAFCTATARQKPADQGWGRSKRPVINVDWYDAIEYCNWRSQKEGLTPCYTIDKTNKDPNNSHGSDAKKWTVRCDWNANGYRLPTEAEWEYAAREGGKKVRFGNGRDLIDPSEINFDARSNYKERYSVVGEYRQKTVPVTELSANALELKNMSGNVWEWCWDWYGDKFYAESNNARDPRGPGAGTYRVARGGSWDDVPLNCRLASRGYGGPDFWNYYLGFRVARHL